MIQFHNFIVKFEDPIVFGLISFIVYCFIMMIKTINEPETTVQRKYGNFWRLNVTYTQLINEIILFSGPILRDYNIKYYPNFNVKYYKRKSILGLFRSTDSTITIYVKGHNSIPDLVDTVLHEIGHYIQKKTDNKNFNKYNQYNLDVGYLNNPLEIEAREFAITQTKNCLKYLVSKNCIQKI